MLSAANDSLQRWHASISSHPVLFAADANYGSSSANTASNGPRGLAQAPPQVAAPAAEGGTHECLFDIKHLQVLRK